MQPHHWVNLLAFVSVLATAVALIALKVGPGQVGVVAAAAALLYGAWRRPGRGD